MATPNDAAINLLGSSAQFLDNTTNVISPGLIILMPFSIETCLQPGGIMDDTVTRLQYCMPATLKANSKDCNFSLCTPTPFVKKKKRGINLLRL